MIILLLAHSPRWATHYLFWQPISVSFTLTVRRALLTLNLNLSSFHIRIGCEKAAQDRWARWRGLLCLGNPSFSLGWQGGEMPGPVLERGH